MPIEHSIAHGQYIVFRATGVVLGAEIIQANEWLYSEFPHKALARFQLWDFSATTQIIVDIDKISAIAEQDKQAVQSLSQIVGALVAPTDLIYGLSRMWQAFADDEAIISHIFRDSASAEAWMLATIAQVLSDENQANSFEP